MSETENIDKEYLEPTFINCINGIDNDSLKNLCNLYLSTYKTQNNYEDMEKLNQECQSILDNELATEHFIRQLKYLFNKGIYGRINKRHKADLIELGISAEKMEIICEVEKKFFETNLEKNDEDDLKQICNLKDFDMMTEMPVVLPRDGLPPHPRRRSLPAGGMRYGNQGRTCCRGAVHYHLAPPLRIAEARQAQAASRRGFGEMHRLQILHAHRLPRDFHEERKSRGGCHAVRRLQCLQPALPETGILKHRKLRNC